MANGAREAAVAEARRAVALQPMSAEFNAHLGHLLLETGEIGEVQALLRRALEAAPDHAQARRSLERLEALRSSPEPSGEGARQMNGTLS